MEMSIRPEESVTTQPTLHARPSIRHCPVCVSGLLTLSERDETLDIYTCIACGTSVSLRHQPTMRRAK